MIFVPKKIKVGYRNRSDTYTNKLAYVIYYDEKNKLRKEASWNSWRDEKIDPDDYDNEPIEGFVLNKKVGGENLGYFDVRQTYVRVYDPRGFEFEITVPNLLYILENVSSIKGKGLEGKFVYGWSGTELVLVPENAPEYVEYMKKQEVMFRNEYIKPSNLIIGHEYLTSNNKSYVYMGKHIKWDTDTGWYSDKFPEIEYQKDVGRYFDNYYSCEERFIKIRNVPEGLKYFFYDQEGKLKIFEKVNKRFYKDCYDQNSPRYLELLDKLNKDSCYNPIDFSKTHIREATFEEFSEYIIELVKQAYISMKLTLYGEDARTERSVSFNKETGNYNLYIAVYSYNKYVYRPISSYKLNNLTLEEVYERINPKMAIYYLENGNEWKRRIV